MTAAESRLILDALAQMGPVTEMFAYAPELGLALRGPLGRQWGDFKEQDPRWRPRQADGMAFLAHLETLPDRTWMDRAAALISLEPIWAAELEASLAWETRELAAADEQTAGATLPITGMELYAPPACLAYAEDQAPEIAWALEALEGAALRDSRPAELAQITAVHPRPFVEAIERFAALGGGVLDPETVLWRGAGAAMRAAAGAMIRAVHDGLERGTGLSACAVRPGSHHAGIARPMGTCVFNNLAVGATWALGRGLERVAIVDVDAHHGNGTREIFAADERVLTISLHQAPFYPSTCGRSAPAQANLDLPLEAGSGPAGLADAWSAALEALDRHRPQLILVEASFDAHALDVVSELGWRTGDYERMFGQMAEIARDQGAPLVLEIGAGLTRAPFQEALNASCRAALAALGA